MCAHRELPYQSAGASLQRSEEAQDQAIVLPLYTQLAHDEQSLVVEALAAAIVDAGRGRGA